jgi:hypothetical protein
MNPTMLRSRRTRKPRTRYVLEMPGETSAEAAYDAIRMFRQALQSPRQVLVAAGCTVKEIRA